MNLLPAKNRRMNSKNDQKSKATKKRAFKKNQEFPLISSERRINLKRPLIDSTPHVDRILVALFSEVVHHI